MKERLLVSVSGGKTSAYMAKRLKDECSDMYEMVYVFANTGQEWEQTFEFLRNIKKFWGIDVVWVEAVVHHGEKRGSTHRIVDFKSASRNGEPFEEVIKKYGIPNQAYPHCTRELKLNPIRSYAASIGWAEYKTAVGIRIDEPGRLPEGESCLQGELFPDEETGAIVKIIYPLASTFPTDKPTINEWFESQPFNLNLQEHQGNCKSCWKKSTSKLIRIAQETPEVFEFNFRMENAHGLAGHNVDGTKRVFFRGNRSTSAILAMSKFLNADSVIDRPDENSGCSESCEPFSLTEFPLAVSNGERNKA